MNSNLRSFKALSALLLLTVVALCSVAQADMIFIGNGNGEVIGRDEANLATEYVLDYLNFGNGWPITELLGVDGDIVIGLGAGGAYNVQLRHADSLSTWVTDVATGFPISALGYRSFDDCILIGDTGPNANGGNGTFVRTRADLTVRPSTYVGLPAYGLTDGGNWGTGITAMQAFADNGDFLVGTAGGYVSTRKANNIWDYTVSGSASGVNFGEPIVGAGIIDNAKFVVGTQTGMLSVRQRANVTLEQPAGNHVTFGLTMTAFTMLPGGKVAVGFADGQVHIRDTADVTAVVPNGYVNVGSQVNALAYTSGGNLVIGTQDNFVYVRKMSDLTVVPEGVALGHISIASGYSSAPNPPVLSLACLNIPPPPVPTIDVAKNAAENSLVVLTWLTVTAVFYDSVDQVGFALENAERTSGIRVISSVPVLVGDSVTVNGTATTVVGERVVDASGGSVVVDFSDYPVPAALGMTNQSSGGGAYGAQGAVVNKAPTDMCSGTNTVGILMKIWGKVTAVNSTGDYDGYFYVDDGSGIEDGSGNVGIKCRPSGTGPTPDALPAFDSNVSVTGVMGVRQISGVNARYFWTQSWQ